MTINSGTGVVTWLQPIPSLTSYEVTIRATNAIDSDTASWQLNVIPGDWDGNAVIDLNDIAGLTDCLSGPGGAPSAGCGCSDVNLDDGIDLQDYGAFQRAFQE